LYWSVGGVASEGRVTVSIHADLRTRISRVNDGNGKSRFVRGQRKCRRTG